MIRRAIGALTVVALAVAGLAGTAAAHDDGRSRLLPLHVGHGKRVAATCWPCTSRTASAPR